VLIAAMLLSCSSEDGHQPSVADTPLPPAILSLEIVGPKGINTSPPRGGTPVYLVDETAILRARVQSIESLHIAIAWSASLTLLTVDVTVSGDGVVEVPVRLPATGDVFTIFDRFQGREVPFVLKEGEILLIEGVGIVADRFAQHWAGMRLGNDPIVPFPALRVMVMPAER
jgi:hypothetical protein